MADSADGAGATRGNRRAIPLRCALDRGPGSCTNLVGKQGGEIVLDVPATGVCVQIILDEGAATVLVEALRTGLRR